MAAHLYWRLNVTANGGDNSFLGIVEVEMRATVGGADQCSGGVASASSQYDNDNNSAARAFNNVAVDDGWYTPATVTSGWLRYQFVSPVEVLQYTIKAPVTQPARAPRDWTLECSANGTVWAIADTQSGITFTTGEVKTFTVAVVATGSLASRVLAAISRIGQEIKALRGEIAAIDTGGGGATTLDGLTDATIASPVDGQVLKYDAGQWKNAALPSPSALATLPDTAISSPGVANQLIHNGSKWQSVVPALSGVSLAIAAMLDSLKKSAPVVLSNGNLTATFTGTSRQAVMATQGQSAGKFYFELTYTGGNSGQGAYVGLAPAGVSLSAVIGVEDGVGAVSNHQSGIIQSGGSGMYTYGWGSVGAVVGVAVDVTAKKVWFRVNGGLWNDGSASNNPATGVGGFSYTAAGEIFPIISAYGEGSYTINMNATGPTGFLPWGTAGLTAPFADLAIAAPADKQLLQYDAATGKWKNVTVAKLYQPHSYLPGKPEADDVLLSVKAGVNASFPEHFAGSYATADVAATAQTVCIVKKDAAQVGTVTFAAGATVGTFVAAGGVTLPLGTRLTIVAPTTPDATLAGVGFTLAGTYS